jgi:osmoprotectant transport system substrate-binding protein
MDRTKIVGCLIALLFTSCGTPPLLVVGSKNFTEQVVLGEILAQQIERQLHTSVIRRLNLGGTLLAHEALVQGSIDLYPEYSGTALTAVLKRPPAYDPAAVLTAIRSEYESKWKLTWLAPFGFNDTFAMIVRGDLARSQHLATLSDAAVHAPWKMGVGYEFQQRPDELAGLLKTYGLKTASDPITMDLGLLYSALDTRKVDMIAANSTDGPASALDVKVLEDDRHYFPPYDCAVIVRDETLSRYPGLRAALEALSGKITAETMRKLNQQVDGAKRPPADVAKEFLDTLR